jgi:peptidoglycan/xylan/chitin deacetylase (PgdA/CDA1 family)
MAQLDLAGGLMTSRIEDWGRHSEECIEEIHELMAAGRCLKEGQAADGDKVVALTFDDGPQPPYTGRILDILDRYGVTATFFCVGMNASVHTEELARMKAAGHGLGNHTWSHPYVPDLSASELSAQIARTDEAIEAATGLRCSLFRPPYGAHDQKLVDLMKATPGGPILAFWNADADDWTMPGAETIATTLLEKIQPGSIALLHDGGGDRSQTAEAVPLVIEGLLGQDYRFVQIPDLIKTT